MTEIDPRLVALGLAPASPEAPPVPVPAAEPLPVVEVARTVAPAPVAAAVSVAVAPPPPPLPVVTVAASPPPVASVVTAAPAPATVASAPVAVPPRQRIAPAVPVSGPALLKLPVEVGFPARGGELTVTSDALIVTGRKPVTLQREQISSIRASHGQVIVSGSAPELRFRPVVDGIAEPTVAAPLARVIEEALAGRFSRSGSAFIELQNAGDGLVDRFHDEDDPLIPALVGLVLLLCGATLAAILPHVFALGVTSGSVPPGAFLIESPVSPFDPRVLVAAVAGAGLLASLGVRLGMGAPGLIWARGTLRGWHKDRYPAVRAVRRALGGVVQFPGVLAAAFLFCLVATLPSARTQVAIDASGIRLVRELPFLDEIRTWRDVTDVAMDPPDVDPLRYDVDVRIFFTGGAVDTQGKYVLGGTELQLLQRASAWRAAAR
ncbi:MAG TPA: hypothetical protein VFM93_05685 [Candidatus Limnocylindria bacterium]|nr:hypothetical protein [Candidatus Limnocylindria bacterium]